MKLPVRAELPFRWRALPLMASGLLLLTASLPAPASPRTIELFNETMKVTPAPLAGAKLYQEFCLECHGSRAHGDAEKVVPSLAGQIERYLVKQLIDFTELDRDAPEMHRLMARPELDNPQAWRDLAAYIASLQPSSDPQVGSGRNLEQGERSYRAYCASCHGTSGEGLEEAPIPALRGQHYSYLLLQLKGFDAQRRRDVADPLLEHMVELSRADMENIADYVSRLPFRARQQTVSTRARASFQ